MYRSLETEAIRLSRLLGELLPFSIVRKFEFQGWKLRNSKIDFPYNWKDEKAPVTFTNEFCTISHDKESVYLRGWFGGESLVLIDGKPYGEINAFHKEVNLTVYCDGKKHLIEIQTVPRGLFGNKEDSVFKFCDIVSYDEDIREVIVFTKNAIDVIKESKNKHLCKALVEITDKFLSSIHLPRNTETYVKTIIENPTIFAQVTSTWSYPDFPTYEITYSLEIKNEIISKFEKYRNEISKLHKIFPKVGKAYVGGHAHIDYAWLWPVEETKRKIVRTFANAVQLAKKYKNFVYIQSSAQMYEDLEKSYPELFEEIKLLVNQGSWETVGGMWVESDCNIPSMESLIRQFYYGQKYFENKFGKISKVAWLPDVFGFSWILPQIMKQAGIEYFVTTKLTWNEANDFPYDICNWRGIDGSEVIYYSFKNFEDGYNGKISARSIINTFENFRQKELSDKFYLSFGYGDGGGGPTEEMCENYTPLNELPGIPTVQYTKVENFFKQLMEDLEGKEIPVWDNELYLELHRGTYTSQSRIKTLHKTAEEELRVTEILNTLLDENHQERIDKLWKILLRNEFHDILPGSSIKEVYEHSENELKHVIDECINIQKSFFSGSDRITLFNPSSYEQSIIFEFDKNVRLNTKFESVKTYKGTYLYHLPDENLQSLSLKTFEFYTVENQKTENFEPMELSANYIMENNKLKVLVYTDGSINIFSKELEKWAFNEKGNILALYKDIPAYWENWDIDFRTTNSIQTLSATKIELLEKNSLREVIRATYQFEKTKIEQLYILEADSDELKIETKIDWHNRRSLLKAIFPTNVLSRSAKYDIDGGYIERPTHSNTNFERARFEVPAHRWVDISQYDFGVCVINNGKYGHKVNGSTIEMSLIKAGIYPDFFADE
ncbi:MAG: glycoside hydrolase family 38 C-terminal domain-containing protein, partial [Fervidobacterium sp.]